MFCILKTEKRKKRIFHKNPPYNAVKTVIPKTAVFEELTVYSYNNRADYYAVKEHLKAFSKSVIFENETFLPKESGIFEYSSNDLKAQMTFNSACYLLEKYKGKNRLKLTVIDKTGNYSALLERLVMLAGQIDVITGDVFRYRYVADEIYENFGAVVNVRDRKSKAEYADITVSLSADGEYPLSITLRSRADKKLYSLVGESFSLPEKIAKYKPENVENYKFASALFSLSGLKKLGEMKYDTFTLNSRTVTLDSAAKMLDTLLNF
ncbi:MAG: hypothetical protein E7515_08405 [Ruminococcaceae bacterium]|nr:hypothetical protein [Oscillospiraceae bacterium]